MKKCSTCNVNKALEDFAYSSRAKDQRQSVCRPCANEVGRANYEANKERYFAKAKERDTEMKDRIRKIKSEPCTDCGIMYPWYVMEFDHLRDKEMEISKMMRRRMAWAKIEAEIAKCELVCANCHRERSYRRWSHVSVETGASQSNATADPTAL